MLNYLTIIKDIATLLGFLLGISFYFKSVFQLNIFQVISWWINNFHSVEYSTPLLIGLLFSLFTSFLVWSTAVNSAYQRLFSEEKIFYFAGKDYYVDPEDLSAKPQRLSEAYITTDTFKNIYKKVRFVRVYNKQQTLQPKARTDPIGLLSFFSFGGVLILVLWGSLHISGYHAFKSKYDGKIENLPTLKESHAKELSKLNLTPQRTAFLDITLIMTGFISLSFGSSIVYGKPQLDISNIVFPGNTLKGKIININKLESYGSNQIKAGGKVDTGRRYADIVFKEGLPTPVHMTYEFHEDEHVQLYEKLIAAKETKQNITFQITDDFGIEISNID